MVSYSVPEKLSCCLELATYRSASLVTDCGDLCQTPVSSPELAHLRTVYFVLHKCTNYYYYYYPGLLKEKASQSIDLILSKSTLDS